MFVNAGGVEPSKNLSLLDDPMDWDGDVVGSARGEHEIEDLAVRTVHPRNVAAQQSQGSIAVRQHGENVACGQSCSLRL